MLSAYEWRFVGEYLKDGNASAAIKRAGYEGDCAGAAGWKMLQKRKVKSEILACTSEAARKVKVDAQDVLRDLKAVLDGDVRSVIEQHNGACRYCHGIGHLYQFKPSELRQLIKEARETGRDYDPQGGDGYLAKRDPHPDCPECEGMGIPYQFMPDTRSLSPEAARLYDGIKPTRHGVEVKIRSRDAARAQMALYLGMNKQTINLADGRKASDMTDDELAAIANGDN